MDFPDFWIYLPSYFLSYSHLIYKVSKEVEGLTALAEEVLAAMAEAGLGRVINYFF